ncbi:MAG: hypothetical protein BM485_01690 [Desulfobulbaceae bacterium DB1]|nr:MAG: hypothetical protein BM485_01690 [Desulfobulbaceae bacterium DB1]
MDEVIHIAKILAQAQDLLRCGKIGNSMVRKSAIIGTPMEILTLKGDLHSWFVPVTLGDRLAGFFQFLSDLTLMRYSSFQRRDDSIEGCPAADSWLDEETIRHLAQKNARPGETVENTFLTFDRTPSRLAWAAVLTSADGKKRTLHIAGQTVWEATKTDNDAESFAGHLS